MEIQFTGNNLVLDDEYDDIFENLFNDMLDDPDSIQYKSPLDQSSVVTYNNLFSLPTTAFVPSTIKVNEKRPFSKRKQSNSLITTNKKLKIPESNSKSDEKLLFKLTVPKKILSLKNMNHFILGFTNSFNSSSLNDSFRFFHDYVYKNCVFRYSDAVSNEIFNAIGVDSIIKYYCKVCDKYPDHISVVKKITSKCVNGFNIIKANVYFSGTMIIMNNKICGFSTEDYDLIKTMENQPIPRVGAVINDISTIKITNECNFIRSQGKIKIKLYLDSTNKVILYDFNGNDLTYYNVDASEYIEKDDITATSDCSTNISGSTSVEEL